MQIILPFHRFLIHEDIDPIIQRGKAYHRAELLSSTKALRFDTLNLQMWKASISMATNRPRPLSLSIIRSRFALHPRPTRSSV